MFRTLIYPSSGACDCVVELPHRSSCSQFVVCWRFGTARFGWCSFCRLKPSDSFSVHHRESSTVHTGTGICHTGFADCSQQNLYVLLSVLLSVTVTAGYFQGKKEPNLNIRRCPHSFYIPGEQQSFSIRERNNGEKQTLKNHQNEVFLRIRICISNIHSFSEVVSLP